MSAIFKKTTVTETIVFLYAILFVYTGISKLMDWRVFKEQVGESPLLGPFAKPVAYGLPWVEFLIVVLLVVPRWRLKGLYAAATLMFLFLIYIIGMFIFDKHLPCSCGGIIQQLSWKGHIVFNSVFLLLAILGIYLERNIKAGHRMEFSYMHT
jgi:uncharacterized membrane protein YphA (DoxX/SURF4 family)